MVDAKKPASTKATADHSTYKEMIREACIALKSPKGVSAQKLCKYIQANYKVKDGFKTHFKIALKEVVAGGTVVRISGTGAYGSFKRRIIKLPIKTKKRKQAAAKKKSAAKKLVNKVVTSKSASKKLGKETSCQKDCIEEGSNECSCKGQEVFVARSQKSRPKEI